MPRSSAMRRFLWVVLCVVGCSPRVGSDCDVTLARTIAYSPGGSPAYAGQSILLTSCAGEGSFCHSDVATERYGAPHGMNFDPFLADDSRFRGDEHAGATHLYSAQLLSHRLRDDIYSQVVSGEMPPGNVGTATLRAAYRTYADASDSTGTAVPSIRSAEGRELLRNWLACGSPVVEATAYPAESSCTHDTECDLTHHCDVAHGRCFGVGAITPAFFITSPHWTSIYGSVIQPTCAVALCHNAQDAATSGGLDLSTPTGAYAALVGTPSSIGACGTRVVAGDPNHSLFMLKLEGTQDAALCGVAMPIGGLLAQRQVDAVRTWIMNGAMMD